MTYPAVSEQAARKAMDVVQERLQNSAEFVGVGVVPTRPKSSTMVVAVYVSKPADQLSSAFKNKVPAAVDVTTGGKRRHVGTKIINIGTLTP